MFLCKHCPEGFSGKSAGGLTRHQAKCPAYLKYEVEVDQRRKKIALKSQEKLLQKKSLQRAKLKDRKARLNSTTLSVRFSLIIYKYHC